MSDMIDRAEVLKLFRNKHPLELYNAIAALPPVSAPVAVPDDHTLLALMLATEEMDNVQGWFRHWTTGDRPVSAWADDPEIAGNYHDAMARLPDFKAAFLEALPPADDAEADKLRRTIAARDRRIERLVAALDDARAKGYVTQSEQEPPVVLSAPDAVGALVKAHEKEIAVWSENYAALERKLDRVECLLQRAVDGYGQKMQAAKSKGEKRDWQTMLIAAADIQNAALAAIRAGGKP
jgi:hypothetical protein